MTALGMTYTGAGGKTEQEMRSVMHLGEDKEAIHDAFQDVVSDLKVSKYCHQTYAQKYNVFSIYSIYSIQVYCIFLLHVCGYIIKRGMDKPLTIVVLLKKALCFVSLKLWFQANDLPVAFGACQCCRS